MCDRPAMTARVLASIEGSQENIYLYLRLLAELMALSYPA